MNRFELDDGARISVESSAGGADEGGILLGGSPLSMFRLTPAGLRIVRKIEAGEELGSGHGVLTKRLAAAGAIHPVFDPSLGPTARDVTLVIPAYAADAQRLAELVRQSGCGRAIVVDDASPTPIGPVDGATVVRLGSNGGPGRARQAGLDLVETPFVVFADADIVIGSSWVAGLLPCFADDSIGLVAPRVRAATPAPDAAAVVRHLARFESARGPLDLGPRRGRIRAGTRVSYVPSAALVCRVSALRDVGGFDPSLRLGEDVDLVWRLDAAGWACRYEPAIEVHHEVRTSVGAWLRQRAGYGFSATDLAVRHPGAVAPAQMSVWSAASWGLVAAGWVRSGASVAAGSTAVLARKLPASSHRVALALRLAGLGHLHAGRTLGNALVRSWWPVSVCAALVSRRARRTLLAALLVPTAIEWWPLRRRIDPVRYLAGRVLDDGAYGFGLWRGAFVRRSTAALRPTLTGWPKRLSRVMNGGVPRPEG